MLLERLGLSRIGIITHNTNLASLLVRRAIINNRNEGNMSIGVVELTPINKNAIVDILEFPGMENKVFFSDNIEAAMGFEGKLFIISIGKPVSQSMLGLGSLRINVYLFISDKSFLMKKMGLETWRIISLEPGAYIAKSQQASVKIVQINNDLVEEQLLSNYLHKAYNLIVDSMMEFGELNIKDTINILMANLGVTKEKAREILEELQLHRKIRISKGKIELY